VRRLHARARPATATVCTILHANCAGSALLPHEHEQRQQRRPAGKSTTKARQPCPSMTVGTATRSSTAYRQETATISAPRRAVIRHWRRHGRPK
jgi:hypothetical protein